MTSAPSARARSSASGARRVRDEHALQLRGSVAAVDDRRRAERAAVVARDEEGDVRPLEVPDVERVVVLGRVEGEREVVGLPQERQHVALARGLRGDGEHAPA
jgi:hypothetical protein